MIQPKTEKPDVIQPKAEKQPDRQTIRTAERAKAWRAVLRILPRSRHRRRSQRKLRLTGVARLPARPGQGPGRQEKRLGRMQPLRNLQTVLSVRPHRSRKKNLYRRQTVT